MFVWNAFILTKQTITSCSVTEKNPESHFSVPWSSLWWSNWAFKSHVVINCSVNKSKQSAILQIFTRTSMPWLRQNDCERAVSLVQAGMTHQAVAGHFNVSRITFSMLMIRLRQTGRTNDRPRNDRPHVTSQRQDIHLCLIHLRTRMITAEDTARIIPGLTNVRISSHTVRRRLRESGLRARRPVVGPIHKQCHRTTKLAWARARRRWRLHTWQHILFCDESWLFWKRKCYGLGRNLSWWSHSRNTECCKIQRRYSWSYRSALSATAKLWSRIWTWQCKISRGSYLSRHFEP